MLGERYCKELPDMVTWKKSTPVSSRDANNDYVQGRHTGGNQVVPRGQLLEAEATLEEGAMFFTVLMVWEARIAIREVRPCLQGSKREREVYTVDRSNHILCS